MKLSELHEQLLGDWSGSKSLWMDPAAEPRRSASSLHVSTAAKGRFLSLRYLWLYEGVEQEGLLLVGNDNRAETASASFVDSWHMGSTIMQCTGSVEAPGIVSVLGSYAAPPGPDWGWRITLSQPVAGSLRLAMTNVGPDGTEYPAVQADYQRG